MVRGEPDARLRGRVRGYCGYTERTARPLRRRELPSGEVSLILNLGGGLTLLDPRYPSRLGEHRESFVAGLHDSYSLTETVGERGVQVDFTPLGAYTFFNSPLEEVSNRVVELEEVFGREADRLVGRLHDAPSWDARFDLLDETIGTRLAEGRPPRAGVSWAWRRLNETHGSVPVRELARDLGWSRRHLAARFREQVGLPPKVVARIARFRRAIALLECDDGKRFAEIAQDCGYYDQAHLNRDFREFAGGSPSDFMARRLPDGGGVAGE